MIRAAASGVLDFAKADLRDPMWHRHVRTLLDAMVDENNAERYRVTFDLQRSILSNSALKPEHFDTGLKTAKMLHDVLIDAIAPWDAGERELRSKSALDQGIDEYKRTAGDPSDPEFRNKLAADYETLQAMTLGTEAVVETDEQRVERLSNARDARMVGKQ